MSFKATPCRTRWEGLAVCAWIVLIDLLLLVWIVGRSTDWLQFLMIVAVVVSLPLLAHLAYRVWIAFSLEYWIDRNAVTIYWAGTQQVIPLGSIQKIIQGKIQDLGKSSWLQWPTPHVRPGRPLGLLRLHLFATRPLDECLLLDTGEQVFAISPQSQDKFLETLQQSYQFGPALNLKITQVRSSFLQKILEPDIPGTILLIMGIIGILALFGIVMIRFPNLPSDLVFRYSPDGSPDLIRSKVYLFLLPAVGTLVWLFNGIWGVWMMVRQQKTGAYMLWGGAIVIQFFSFIALTRLTG